MSENKSSHTILVTGVGGNVGQGVLRNIRDAYPDIKLVSTDIAEFTAGHHYSDYFYQVPYCYEPEYKEKILSICKEHNIDLVIPATDYESYHLALFSAELPVLIASAADVTQTFLDKYKTYLSFSSNDVPFAKAYLVSEYDSSFEQIVVKPREGRGSRGVHFNPDSLDLFDDSYIVQEKHSGEEITTAFYVTKDNLIHGGITFCRELSAGMTERCFVTNKYNDVLQPLLEKIISKYKIVGPCNLQSIATPENQIYPFEVNCRYSGTNSIRSQFGFQDVKYGIQEHLFNQKPDPVNISGGSAIRIYMDIIYKNVKAEDIKPGNSKSYLY